MKKAIKLSHKALKEMGAMLNGYYFDGNIYAHENRVHYLQSIICGWNREEEVENAKTHCSEISELVDNIRAIGADSVSCRQLAYSCGYYGNSGQLHRIDYIKNGETVKTLYLYC